MRLRLKELREDKDLTRSKVATYLGVDQSLYSKYELGKRIVPLRIIVKLAIYYGVSTDYLLGLTDDPKLPEKSSYYNVDFHYE